MKHLLQPYIYYFNVILANKTDVTEVIANVANKHHQNKLRETSLRTITITAITLCFNLYFRVKCGHNEDCSVS